MSANAIADLSAEIDVSEEDPEGELVEGEPVDGEPVDGEPVDGEPVDGEPVDGEPVDGEPVDGEPVDGEPVDGVSRHVMPVVLVEVFDPNWTCTFPPIDPALIEFFCTEYSVACRFDDPTQVLHTDLDVDEMFDVATDGKKIVNGSAEERASDYLDPSHTRTETAMSAMTDTTEPGETRNNEAEPKESPVESADSELFDAFSASGWMSGI